MTPVSSIRFATPLQETLITAFLATGDTMFAEFASSLSQHRQWFTNSQKFSDPTASSQPLIRLSPAAGPYIEGNRLEIACLSEGNPTPKVIMTLASGQKVNRMRSNNSKIFAITEANICLEDLCHFLG